MPVSIRPALEKIKMAYITVSTDVDIDIDLDDYKDEIERMLRAEWDEPDSLIEELAQIYRVSGGAAVIEHVEREINNLTGLSVDLKVAS